MLDFILALGLGFGFGFNHGRAFNAAPPPDPGDYAPTYHILGF